MLENTESTVLKIRELTSHKPEIAIILGTGLAGLANHIKIIKEISYEDLPGFASSTVKGHHGQLIFGMFNGIPVVAMKGRLHVYEGYSARDVSYPVKIFKQLGIHTIILSNASGGLNPDFRIGDIMLVKDHINLMESNPLQGPMKNNPSEYFLDLSGVYDSELIGMTRKSALSINVDLKEGIYAGVTGPTFETPAEYKYIRMIGADAVGMSTIPEAVVARQLGIKVLAFSVISDLGVEGKIVEISHDDVIDAASHAEPTLTKVIVELMKGLKSEYDK
jgi:purine-nucleoside phosphorylase